MKEATVELDPEGWSDFVWKRNGGHCRKGCNNQQRQKRESGRCVLEQCTVSEWEPKETCRRVMGIRPGLENGKKGGASEQILSFGAWARSLTLIFVFNPDRLFYPWEIRWSEKHDIRLHIPQVALCLVPSRSSKDCLNAGMTNQQAHAQPLCYIALLDLFLIDIGSRWQFGIRGSQ